MYFWKEIYLKMKRTYLKLYGKLVAALLSVFVAFTGCCTKKSVDKSDEVVENKDTTIKKDSVSTFRKGKFPGGEVIAMYGVRRDQLEK